MCIRLAAAACALLGALAAHAADGEAPSRLDVTAEPEGASVYVDGVLQGPAPCTVFGLEAGRHLVRVASPSFVPQHAFVEVKPGVPARKAFQLAEEKGLILVRTDPAGADVKCGGVSLGATPLLVTTLASGRPHSLDISLNGYQTKRIEVRTDGRRPLVREERLALDSGVIECSSEPSGATVVVNGIERGVTPARIEKVPKGLATVTFRLKGYNEETRELRMQAGATQTLALRLKGKAARLKVVSTPESARVFLDDDFQGKTPLDLSSVKPGRHVLRVELGGFADARREIDVENDGAATEEFVLESVLGRIEVITSPPGARVLVDGRAAGTTEAQGDAPKSKLLAIENVSAGSHTVLVRCDGHQDRAFKINVQSRETTQLFARLTRVFTPNILLNTSRGPVRGVLVERDLLGNVTVETAPGVRQFVPVGDIRKISMIEK